MKNILTTARMIKKLIESYKTIIIHRHVNPDGDAMGAQLGLKHIINYNFPNKKVLTPGEINNFMSSFFPPPDIVELSQYNEALVIVCDTANRERVSGTGWQTAKKIIKFDHHPEVDKYAHINFVDSSATATCQLIVRWAQSLHLHLNEAAARNLFLGLVTDSGRFLYRSVNSETFAVASYLTKFNFDMVALYEQLYAQTVQIARIKGYVLNNFRISFNGVGYLICNRKQLQQLNKKIHGINNKINQPQLFKKEDITAQVNLIANTEGVKICLIACQDNSEPEYKVSVRSSSYVINEIVAKFNGGGHRFAAACRLSSIREVKKLLAALDVFVK